MSNREKWNFNYTVGNVLVGAQKKLDRHKARLDWWDGQKQEVFQKIRDEGVEIDESLADVISNSYNRGPTVQIRNDLIKDMQECVAKIREHRAKVDGYLAWVKVLVDQDDSHDLELNHADWLYFFGDQPVDEDV